MLNVKHPETGVECDNAVSKLNAVSSFYADRPIDEPCCLQRILDYIDKSISEEDANIITIHILFEQIEEGARRSPAKSSPGFDGLPYEIQHIIISHPNCRALVLEVYNDAIGFAEFPNHVKRLVSFCSPNLVILRV